VREYFYIKLSSATNKNPYETDGDPFASRENPFQLIIQSGKSIQSITAGL
jgi:hypothetical protein